MLCPMSLFSLQLAVGAVQLHANKVASYGPGASSLPQDRSEWQPFPTQSLLTILSLFLYS